MATLISKAERERRLRLLITIGTINNELTHDERELKIIPHEPANEPKLSWLEARTTTLKEANKYFIDELNGILAQTT